MWRDHGHADERRVLLELPTQVALLAQPIQRVLDRLRRLVGEHRLDDGREGLDGRDVAVQQTEGLAIVRSDADLEQDAGARRRSDRRWCIEIAQLREVSDRRGLDDPADLEPAHLAGDDAVFDVHAGSSCLDHGREREVLRTGRSGRREWFGHDRQQRAALGVPDGGGEGEALRPAGELPGVVLDDQVQRRRVVAYRPASAGPSDLAAGPSTSTHAAASSTSAAPDGKPSGSGRTSRPSCSATRARNLIPSSRLRRSSVAGRSSRASAGRSFIEANLSARADRSDAVAGHVGQQVNSAGVVVEPDTPAGADLGDDQVRDGPPTRDVEARRVGVDPPRRDTPSRTSPRRPRWP